MIRSEYLLSSRLISESNQGKIIKKRNIHLVIHVILHSKLIRNQFEVFIDIS